MLSFVCSIKTGIYALIAVKTQYGHLSNFFVLEGTLKLYPVPPCHGKRHLPLSQGPTWDTAKDPGAPSLNLFSFLLVRTVQ